MASTGGKDRNASQFYVTLGRGPFGSLDGKQTIFGQVAEDSSAVLARLNEAPVDGAAAAAAAAADDAAALRPCRNVRIRHTIVLDDPFDDPEGLVKLVPPSSPPPAFDKGGRLEDDWRAEGEGDGDDDANDADDPEAAARREARQRAVVLEMVGDLPTADAAPPDSVLFVCKLNPATQAEDLELIFSRFGKVVQCDVARDRRSGDSLGYAFIGYDRKESAEKAYFHMDGALVDDRRIRVDFSQSVGHLWRGGGGGAGRGGGRGGGRGRGATAGAAAAPAAPSRPGSRWGPPLPGAAAVAGGSNRYIAVAPTPVVAAAAAAPPLAAAADDDEKRERRRSRDERSGGRSRSRSRSPRDRDRRHRHRHDDDHEHRHHRHHRSSRERDRSRSRERERGRRERSRSQDRHRRRHRSRSR
jgi:peptidyl-prolyl cis-trans isomerase-like 4